MTSDLAVVGPGHVIEDPRISRTLSYEVDVPPLFVGSRLDAFEPRKGTQRGLKAARALADAPDANRGLVLFGGPGSGKTHLAVGVLAARVAAWYARYPEASRTLPDGFIVSRPPMEDRFIVVPTLLDRLRAGIEYRDAVDPLPELMKAKLLVLDDLGREKSTDWVLERLYVLVNERYNHLLPTVVTSNFSPAQLLALGYDAVLSRLVASSDVVHMEATDYRVSQRAGGDS